MANQSLNLLTSRVPFTAFMRTQYLSELSPTERTKEVSPAAAVPVATMSLPFLSLDTSM